MRRFLIIIFSLIVPLSIAVKIAAQKEEPPAKAPTSRLSDRIVGTWKLVAVEDKLPDGKLLYPMGRNPIGYLMYDSTGHMSQQLMNPDRPRVALRGATKEELNEIVFLGFDAYSGTYSINEEESAITYRVECSIYPTVVGTELKRKIEITDDRLMIIPSPLVEKSDGLQRTRTNVWKRVK